jgi:hypothetical protein
LVLIEFHCMSFTLEIEVENFLGSHAEFGDNDGIVRRRRRYQGHQLAGAQADFAPRLREIKPVRFDLFFDGNFQIVENTQSEHSWAGRNSWDTAADSQIPPPAR